MEHTDNDDGTTPIDFIDAHHHYLDAEKFYYPRFSDQPLGRFRYGSYENYPKKYLPADFRRDSANQRVVASVHMECEWDPDDPVAETHWVSELAREHGTPNALVARAFLDRPDVAEVLERHAAYPLTRGIRHKPRAASRPEDARRGGEGSMDDPVWRKGYDMLSRFGFSFDLQVPWWHFDQAQELARDFPQTTIILDHCGLPADRSAPSIAAWRDAMTVLADAPNVVVKVSGIGVLDAPWTAEANRQVVLDTINIFGTSRSMIASNWPADSLAAASYDTIIDGFREICKTFSYEDQLALFRDNAARVYRLEFRGAQDERNES